MKRSTPLLIGAGALALALGFWASSHWRGPAPMQSGVLLPQPRPLPEFRLTDQDGAALTRDRLRGHWTLLFAGFTHCPDVCPTTLGLMKAVEQRLAAEGRASQLLFLSVDPQRDSPARLREYVRYFSPTLIGATGEPAQLDAVCAALGLAYARSGEGASYTVDHSSALVLINPDGAAAAYFQPPHRLDALVADLATVIPSRT